MRLQDKLTRLHRETAHAGMRRYLVRELERVVAGLDSERVVDLLQEAAGSADPGEAFQARRSLFRFLPRHVVRRYGSDAPVLSVVVGSQAAGESVGAAGGAALEVARTLAREAADGVVRRVRAAGSSAAWPLMLSLARCGGSELDLWLAEAIEAPAPDPFAAVVRVARAPEGVAADELLAPLAARARAEPELAASIAELAPGGSGSPAVARLLDEASRSRGWLVPAALAVEALDGRPRRELLDRISDARNGWAIVHALSSLAAVATVDDLPAILTVFRRYRHPIVRVEVARCLGRIPHSQARDVIRQLVRIDPSSLEAAAALESLVRQGVPDDERRAIFSGVMQTNNAEVFASACLGLVGLEPELAARGVRTLLAGGPEGRIHALHVMGYLPGPDSARFLARCAVDDPDPAVRNQAVASLACHPPSEPLAAALLDLVGTVEPDLKPTVARALVRAQQEHDPRLARVLIAAVDETTGRARRHLIQAIGLVEGGVAREYLSRLMLDDACTDDLVGALGAAAVSARRWKSLPVLRWLTHADPAVASAAAVAVLQEDVDAAFAAASRLAASDRSFATGAKTLGILTTILEECLSHPRYVDLAAVVTGRLGGRERAPDVSRPSIRDMAALVDPGSLLLGPVEGAAAVRAARGVVAGEGAGAERDGPQPAGPQPAVPVREFRRRPVDVARLDRPFAPHLPLIAAACATLLLAIVVVRALSGSPASSRPASDRVPPYPDAVTVVSSEAGARVLGRPVHRNLRVVAPADLDASQGEMELSMAGGGGAIRMSRGSRLRLETGLGPRAAGEEPATLKTPAGDIAIELASTRRVTIDLSPGLVTLYEGKFKLCAAAGQLALSVESGRALARAGPDRVQMILAGQQAIVVGGVVVGTSVLRRPE